MAEDHSPQRWKRRTLSAQAMGRVDEATRAVVAPIHVSTTFLRDPDNSYSSGFVYGRPDNATIREAEAVLAMWEGGAAALALSSGMSAALCVFMALEHGDHIVAPSIMYWALRAWLKDDAPRWGLRVTFATMSDLDAVRAAVEPGRTKLIWLETPSNPLWSLTDIAGVASLARETGARVVVDSTAATPVFTRPLALGADIVMHAATKALNGHSDVVAGALVSARIDAFWARIVANRKNFGTILGPFEAFLLIRGMRTLDLRVRAAAASALILARRLLGHRHVVDVLYPGLEHHPGHALAARQMEGGFGSMLSVRVAGGEACAIATAAQVRLWKRATSLGGVESLIEHRASIEGPDSPCPPDLLRLSVGIEDLDDLFEDLDQALRAAHARDAEDPALALP